MALATLGLWKLEQYHGAGSFTSIPRWPRVSSKRAARDTNWYCWLLLVPVARCVRLRAVAGSLEKEVANLGVVSRRQLGRLIRSGRVTVDGEVVRNPKEKVAPAATLAIDAIELHREPPILLKFHKPFDVISSMYEKNRTDLKDALPGQRAPWDEEAVEEARIASGGQAKVPEVKEMLAAEGLRPWIAVGQYHPVGRLDRDTTGLLLFSRDGVLTSKLLAPTSEVPRCYEAVVEGDATKPLEDGGLTLQEKLRKGVITQEGIFDAQLLAAELLDGQEVKSKVKLEVSEGKYRMVRKMLYNCGHAVLELHRVSYGPLELGDLKVGRMCCISPQEAAWANDLEPKLLLIILPGRSGREAVLRRIIAEVGPVAVLVPQRLFEASSWAKPLVDAWIDFEDQELEDAWTAVSRWMDSSQRSISGCTTWDEWGIEICAYLCERLHLPYTPLSTVRQVRNKFHFRELCRKAGLPSCRCANIQRKDELLVVLKEDWRYPLMLKPARGAGSYYCRKVECKEELLEVFESLDDRLRNEKKTPQDDVRAGWILEEFFSGLEVDVDGWAKDGEVEWMLVSDNKPVLSHACCETGGVYPSQLPEHLVELLRELTRKVVSSCAGLHSAFHFEALVKPESQEVMPVELNLRLGGAECPCGVEAVSGVFLPLAAARLALGQATPRPCEPKVKVAASTNEYAEHAGIVEACEGSEDLSSDPAFLGAAFFATPGARYEPMRGSISCLCWICAGGRDAAEAEENLRRCISLCKLQVSKR